MYLNLTSLPPFLGYHCMVFLHLCPDACELDELPDELLDSEDVSLLEEESMFAPLPFPSAFDFLECFRSLRSCILPGSTKQGLCRWQPCQRTGMVRCWSLLTDTV